MSEFKHIRAAEAPPERVNRHEGYEFIRKSLVTRRDAAHCRAALYELPPGKSAYPYHYHSVNEEVFYITGGRGLLRTPGGEREVLTGDLLFFPAGEAGAHKLTNASDTEPLTYVDFDVEHRLDAAVYPDSGKIGLWGADINKVFKLGDSVGYYEGE